MDWRGVEISFDETHHILDGKPIYNKRFKKVMSYHSPGVAAVCDGSGAYHIDISGNPIYEKRFKRVYGYYEDLATVEDERGYFHIDLNENEVYSNRYEWAGNFQEGRCVVRDFEGNYFHIKRDGKRAYKENYAYAGDYKYGIAVVYNRDGYATHIDKDGNLIHGKFFLELDVYHKGFAIARDEFGYFHIDKKGEPLYSQRYEWVEPFYNDFALVRDFNGEMKIIDYKGKIIRVVNPINSKSNVKRNFRDISNRLTGYIQSQILHSIAKLGILESIKDKGNIEDLNIHNDFKNIVLDYLTIYGFIEKTDNRNLKLTELGKIFLNELKNPALLWGEEHYIVMSKLYEALIDGKEKFSDIYGIDYFSYLNLDENKEKLDIYQSSLEKYSQDYESVADKISIDKNIKNIADIGGGNLSLLKLILSKYPFIENAYLFDLPNTIKRIENKDSRIKLVEGNFFESIPLKDIDVAFMSRILHDWNDEKAKQILNNVNKILKKGGKLYILETIIPENPNYDIGISISFLLLTMVGGRERKLSEFDNLLKNTGFNITNVIDNTGLISIIEATKV